MTAHLSDSAVFDHQSISAYTIGNWGEHQEEKYLTEIWDKLNEISETPEKFRFRNDLFPSCQIASSGEHLILFRIEESRLEVARVLHCEMDLKRHI